MRWAFRGLHLVEDGLVNLIAAARSHVLRRFRWIGGDADTWTMLRDPESLRAIADGLTDLLRNDEIDLVVGIEARGFVLAPLVAVGLGVGFSPVRKDSSLFPGETQIRMTDVDYRGNTNSLAIRSDHFHPGLRVALVDDWIETGSQAVAAANLVAGTGARLVAVAVVIDEASDAARSALPPIRALALGQDLPDPASGR